MSFQTKRLNDRELDRLFRILLEGQENAGLDEKRKIVNSILPVQKYKLLLRFLSEEEYLSEDIIVKCLSIFLDENTKLLGFERNIRQQTYVKSILEIIPKYCPNIETIDLRRVWISSENKENFKTFLKQTTQLKSLQVNCYIYKSAIHELMIEEDFNPHDEDVKIGLEKIEYINGIHLNGAECARLLKLLPNLKSLGMGQRLSVVLPFIDDEIPKKLSNITEFHDKHTCLTSLECFSKYCPDSTKISLWYPEENVIENLLKFPLLTEIEIITRDSNFSSELIKMLNIIGEKIKILRLCFPTDIEIGLTTILHDLCPELLKLDINDEIFRF